METYLAIIAAALFVGIVTHVVYRGNQKAKKLKEARLLQANLELKRKAMADIELQRVKTYATDRSTPGIFAIRRPEPRYDLSPATPHYGGPSKLAIGAAATEHRVLASQPVDRGDDGFMLWLATGLPLCGSASVIGAALHGSAFPTPSHDSTPSHSSSSSYSDHGSSSSSSPSYDSSSSSSSSYDASGSASSGGGADY